MDWRRAKDARGRTATRGASDVDGSRCDDERAASDGLDDLRAGLGDRARLERGVPATAAIADVRGAVVPGRDLDDLTDVEDDVAIGGRVAGDATDGPARAP